MNPSEQIGKPSEARQKGAKRSTVAFDSTLLFETGKEAVLTLEEASRLFFRRHPKTVQLWIRQGKVPSHYDAGNRPVFLLSELVAWLARRKGKPR